MNLWTWWHTPCLIQALGLMQWTKYILAQNVKIYHINSNDDNKMSLFQINWLTESFLLLATSTNFLRIKNEIILYNLLLVGWHKVLSKPDDVVSCHVVIPLLWYISKIWPICWFIELNLLISSDLVCAIERKKYLQLYLDNSRHIVNSRGKKETISREHCTI